MIILHGTARISSSRGVFAAQHPCASVPQRILLSQLDVGASLVPAATGEAAEPVLVRVFWPQVRLPVVMPRIGVVGLRSVCLNSAGCCHTAPSVGPQLTPPAVVHANSGGSASSLGPNFARFQLSRSAECVLAPQFGLFPFLFPEVPLTLKWSDLFLHLLPFEAL